MAFDVQGALNAGYSQQEINNYMQQNNLQSQPSSQQAAPAASDPGTGFLQGASNLARTVGLGIIPDIAAPAYMAGQEIMQGKNPTPYGGDQATLQQLQQDAQSNPFGNQQNLQQEGGSLPAIANQVGLDSAHAAAWGLPWGKGGILARPATGAAGGLLGSMGQSPQNMAKAGLVGAVTNTILPGIGEKLIPNGIKMASAGSKIGDLIQGADLTVPNKQAVIDANLENRFGTLSQPNTKLIPPAPAQETGNLMKLLKKEIASQGRGELGNTSFEQIHNWEQGTGAQGGYQQNSTSATQKLFQNIQQQYSGLLKDEIPGLGDQFSRYSKAATAIAKHGKGIKSLLNDPLIRYGLIWPTMNRLYTTAGNLIGSGVNAATANPAAPTPSNNTSSSWANPYSQ